MREELREASTTYDTICQKLNSELDRIDSQRMLEVEQGINRLLRNLLDAQTEVCVRGGCPTHLPTDCGYLGQLPGCERERHFPRRRLGRRSILPHMIYSGVPSNKPRMRPADPVKDHAYLTDLVMG